MLLNILSCPSHPEKKIKIQLVPPTGDVTALHTEYVLAKKEKERKKKTALFDFPVMLVWI